MAVLASPANDIHSTGQMKNVKVESLTLPEGWAASKKGHLTTAFEFMERSNRNLNAEVAQKACGSICHVHGGSRFVALALCRAKTTMTQKREWSAPSQKL